MNKGMLYGVGVGPGDPELLTLKAARLIRECDIAAIPEKAERCFAYRIAVKAVPELTEKPLLEIVMPMTRDKALREEAWKSGASLIAEQLDAGKTVVFLTLGDPSVYSTFGYLGNILREAGYETGTVPGVPSFCAAAASLSIPLCEDREELHLIPGGKRNASGALSYPGTIVFMKGNLPELLAELKKGGYTVLGAQNCGTGEEALYRSLDEIPEDAGYYTVVIAKEKRQ